MWRYVWGEGGREGKLVREKRRKGVSEGLKKGLRRVGLCPASSAAHMCVVVTRACLPACLQVLQLHHLERLRVKEEQLHAKQQAACLNDSNSTSTTAGSTSSSCPPAAAEGLASFAEPSDPDSPAFMAQLSLVGEGLESLPDNCRPLCAVRGGQEERAAELALHRALPLLPLELRASRRIRCVCLRVWASNTLFGLCGQLLLVMNRSQGPPQNPTCRASHLSHSSFTCNTLPPRAAGTAAVLRA